MKIKYIFFICLFSTLVGCSDKKETINYTYVATPHVPAEIERGDAQVQIAEASTSIGQSLDELSAIQIATNPHVSLPPLNPRTLGMTQLVSVNWNGPIEPLLNKIAQTANYRFHTIGETPAIPVLVSIDAHNRMLAEILQDTIYQSHTKADIIVDPNTRDIELRYYAP